MASLPSGNCRCCRSCAAGGRTLQIVYPVALLLVVKVCAVSNQSSRRPVLLRLPTLLTSPGPVVGARVTLRGRARSFVRAALRWPRRGCGAVPNHWLAHDATPN